jgi:mono/diheme cytochrome c family protein
VRTNLLHRTAALASLSLLAACASKPAERTPADPGRTAYSANCLACHQADGGGVPGFQPPLVGSAWVRGDPQVLATFVLTGGFDSASRKQSASENVMPPFLQLDDATLATILTYVRTKFGGNPGSVVPEPVTPEPVTPEQVAAARALLPRK